MEAKNRPDPEKQKDQVARTMQIPGSDAHQAIRQACPGYPAAAPDLISQTVRTLDNSLGPLVGRTSHLRLVGSDNRFGVFISDRLPEVTRCRPGPLLSRGLSLLSSALHCRSYEMLP